MANIRMIANNVYVNGQTDGMKVWEKEFKDGSKTYAFAANKKDANIKMAHGYGASWLQVSEHLKQLMYSS